MKTMPLKDGLQALTEIRQYDPTARVIMLTALGQTMAATRAKMDAIDERTDAQLAELLTTEQMEEYREMMRKAAELRQSVTPHMGARPGGPGGGPRGGGGR